MSSFLDLCVRPSNVMLSIYLAWRCDKLFFFFRFFWRSSFWILYALSTSRPSTKSFTEKKKFVCCAGHFFRKNYVRKFQKNLLDQGSNSPTYLQAAFKHVVPKSVRVSQVISLFLRFWDLLAEKLYVERWWNWAQVSISPKFCASQKRKRYLRFDWIISGSV